MKLQGIRDEFWDSALHRDVSSNYWRHFEVEVWSTVKCEQNIHDDDYILTYYIRKRAGDAQTN